MREQVLKELQMLTGIVSDDLTYLFEQLVKGGEQQQEAEAKTEFMNDVINEDMCEADLDDWFDGL